MKHLTKRIVTLALALVMVLSLIPAASAYSGVASWAEDKVASMDELGLIPGSLADADLSKSISRLDMCRMAVLAYEKIKGETIPLPDTHPFTDTTDPDVEKAYAAGLVGGYEDQTYRPDNTLTRLEFFVIVGGFVKTAGYPVSDKDYASLSRFVDAGSIPQWGVPNTQLTVGLGIVAGTGNALDWPSPASRQEAITLFLRAYQVSTGDIPETPNEGDESEPSGDFINMASWAEKFVTSMDDMGLIPASVKSSPMNGPITRQDQCKIIMRTYKRLIGVTDSDLGTPEDPFSDTHDIDVRNAYRLGIVSGVGNGKFAPNDPITRQDFFKMSVNFLNAIGYPYTVDETCDLSSFVDSDRIASYAVDATRLLVGIQAVGGNTNKELCPRDAIVSQEAICIFYQIYNFVSTWVAPAETPDQRPEEDVQQADNVVDYAKQYLGYPYIYGGKSPESGFDCSGFVYYVYKNFGYTLNPGATSQWKSLPDAIIPRDDLRPGDLVFFSDNGEVSGMTHVGIYIGEGQMIHASTPSTGVIITRLSEPYYVRMYLGAKRVIQ